MERVNLILRHPLYRDCLSQIAGWERTRIFCGHDMTHFLDVARLPIFLIWRRDWAFQRNGSTRQLCSTISAGTSNTRRGHPIRRQASRLRTRSWRRRDLTKGNAGKSWLRSEIIGIQRLPRKKIFPVLSTGRTSFPEAALPVRRRRNVTGAEKRKI